MIQVLHIDFDYVKCVCVCIYIYMEQYSRATFSILLLLSGNLLESPGITIPRYLQKDV